MKKKYGILKSISIGFKVLAILGFIGTMFITIANLVSSNGSGPGMIQQNFAFVLFNNLFPIFFGLVQTLFLYSIGELILLFIDIKTNLDRTSNQLLDIKNNL